MAGTDQQVYNRDSLQYQALVMLAVAAGMAACNVQITIVF